LAEIALALRSELYDRHEITEFSKLADSSSNISYIFFPDIPNGQDSVELSSASLALTKRIKIGSGVLRLLEQDSKIFSRRIATVQWMSGNRFVLGIGTGSPGVSPSQTIQRMFSLLEETRKNFPARFQDQPVLFPDILVAALKSGIAIKSIGHADGLILNFCSPEYSEKIVSTVNGRGARFRTIVCYIKIFYSRDQNIAETLLAEEFVKYDRLPQYHLMFDKDGVTENIASLRASLSSSKRGKIEIPEGLKKISLANPSSEELTQTIRRFQDSGINLPCVYPYFSTNETTEFKRNIMTEITKLG
jgi:hypothetical protein